MNYEKEIGDKLLEELKNLFTENIQDLHPYLLARYIIDENKTKKDFGKPLKKQYMNYIFNLLHIQERTYKDEMLYQGINHENSLYVIVSNWWESTLIDDDEIIKEALNSAKRAKLKVLRTHLNFLRDESFVKIIHLAATKELNEDYGIFEDSLPRKIPGFVYEPTYVGGRAIVVDEYLDITRNSPYYKNKFDEFMVKQYLLTHMGDLEPGLQIKRRNEVIKGVPIDFITKDQNGILTIIHVTVKKMSTIVYQSEIYKKELMKIYDVDKIRVIFLFSQRDPYVENYIDDVEIFHIEPKVRFKKIKDIQFTKIEKTKE